MGVMAKTATSALEDIGFTRAEVKKLYTECMRETLYKVKAMKAAHVEGFKSEEELRLRANVIDLSLSWSDITQ